ncbi:MAG: hemerythrin domain-containing protein [Phycisphaerales bacterium]
MLNLLNRQPDHGFDEPIGLLTDCHRRIEKFLDVLLRVAREYGPGQGGGGRPFDAQARAAVETAKRYFLHAAPRHTADEEESLFPRLKAAIAGRAAGAGGGAGATGSEAMRHLQDDHKQADAMHARVDALLEVWLRAENGTFAPAHATELLSLLESLRELYRGHIEVEEKEVFPLAEKVLTASDLAAVGEEMQARRGIGTQP